MSCLCSDLDSITPTEVDVHAAVQQRLALLQSWHQLEEAQQMQASNDHRAAQQRLTLVQSRGGAPAPPDAQQASGRASGDNVGSEDWRAALAEAMAAERQAETAAASQQQQQPSDSVGEDIDERGWLPK